MITLQRPGRVTIVLIAVAASLLAVVGVSLVLFGWRTGITPRAKHTESVHGVAFSADGKRIVSGSADGTVIVWEADKGEQVLALPRVSFLVRSVGFLRDDQRIFAAGGRHDPQASGWWGVVAVLDARTGKQTFIVDGQPDIRCAAGSPDGSLVATGHANGTIVVWDADTGVRKRDIKAHQEPNWVDSLAFSPDGKRLASASSDQTVKVVDAESGEEISVLTGHKNYVHCVAFSRDGKRIASGGREKAIIVWDAGSGNVIWTLKGHKGYINSLAFSPDGNRLVSGSRVSANSSSQPSIPGELKMWDIEGGKEVMAFTGHKGAIQSVTYGADNERFVTSGGGAGPERRILGSLIPWPEITLWNATTGAKVFSIGGP